MTSTDVQIVVSGSGAAPFSYTLPMAQFLMPKSINAVLDGSATVSNWLPTLEVISDAGVVVARVPCQTAVGAGGSCECTWAPFLGELSTGGVVLTPYEKVILARPNLALYWKLDELSGTTAHDYSGNGLDGTYSSTGMTIGVPPLADRFAFQFANSSFFGHNWAGGPNSTVRVAGNGIPPQPGNAFSVEMWVKTSQAAADAPRFFTASGGSTASEFLGLSLSGTSTLEVFMVDNGGTGHVLDCATTINDGVRHQIGMTFDGTTIKGYVDATLDGSLGAVFTRNPIANGEINVNGREIGSQIWDHGYTGVIDEVSYYTGALALSDYQASYAARV